MNQHVALDERVSASKLKARRVDEMRKAEAESLALQQRRDELAREQVTAEVHGQKHNGKAAPDINALEEEHARTIDRLRVLDEMIRAAELSEAEQAVELTQKTRGAALERHLALAKQQKELFDKLGIVQREMREAESEERLLGVAVFEAIAKLNRLKGAPK